MLFSCEDASAGAEAPDDPALMTEYCEDLTIVMSQNGRRSYIFETPLLEGYSQASEPYREFRKGVKITTYKDDSLSTVNSVLTANYAIYYGERELWEAKGNVVVEKADGTTLYTQQLFWNARTRRIYSNVDSRIVQRGGRQDVVGEGFESDEEFNDWRFRRSKGRLEVQVKPSERTDSTSSEEPARPVPPDPDERAAAPRTQRAPSDGASSRRSAGTASRDVRPTAPRPADGAALPPSPVSGRFTAPARAGESDDGVRPEVRRMQQMQRMKSQRMQDVQMQTGKAAPTVSPMTSPASADPNPSPAPAAPAAASASSASAGSSAPQPAPASSPDAAAAPMTAAAPISSAAPMTSAAPISSVAPAASGSERPDTQTGE